MDGRQKSIRMPVGSCPPVCPGCAHQHLSDAESRAQKQQWLKTKLAPYADRLQPIVASPGKSRAGYRRKVCLAAAWEPGEGWRLGLRYRHIVLPIPDCPIHNRRIRATAALCSRRLPPFSDFPLVYFVQSGAQVTLVLKSGKLPESGWLDPVFEGHLRRAGIEGLWLNLHPSAGRRIFSKRGWHLIRGNSRSVDEEGLVYGPTAFQQQIPDLYQKALGEAENFLNPSSADLMVDLYCGIGASLRRWAAKKCSVAGVELDGEAVDCAGKNAPAAAVFRGRCRDRIIHVNGWIRQMESGGGSRLLFANPPRTGLEPEITGWIGRSCRPLRMAYLSCSAGTLSRDLALLETAGYRVERITPYDFFPRTLHVETLACLQRTG